MFRVRYYNLENKFINENIKLVNITDVHSDVEKLKNALLYANSIKADLITIAGDLFDSVDNKNNQAIVELFGNTQIRTVICLGNHDLISFDRKGPFAKVHENNERKYFEKLKEYGHVTVMDDNQKSVSFKDIEIITFDPGYSWYFESKENRDLFQKLLNEYLNTVKKSNKFRIMLLHSCNGLLDNNELKRPLENINLVLSGHNHAGIMPDCLQGISKYNRGIIGPFEKWFMKSCYGTWTNGDTSIVLSNGLTKMGESHGASWLCSLINNSLKSDIEVINLKKGESHKLVLEKKELKRNVNI